MTITVTSTNGKEYAYTSCEDYTTMKGGILINVTSYNTVFHPYSNTIKVDVIN